MVCALSAPSIQQFTLGDVESPGEAAFTGDWFLGDEPAAGERADAKDPFDDFDEDDFDDDFDDDFVRLHQYGQTRCLNDAKLERESVQRHWPS